jgi:hypothetical protein
LTLNNNYRVIICPQCNNEFKLLREGANSRARKFCSELCSKEHERLRALSYSKLHPTKKEWYRNNVLGMGNGKSIIVRKRHFVGICELCGKSIESRPQWHHWDDNHPEQGIWVHYRCHRVCEAVEFDLDGVLMEKYKCLKKLYTTSE